jgi:hypothetical protein
MRSAAATGGSTNSAGPAECSPALLTGYGRCGVIRLIHRHSKVSYFVQFQISARIKLTNTGRFASPQLPGARSCVPDPSRAHTAGVFFICGRCSALARRSRPAAAYSAGSSRYRTWCESVSIVMGS